MMPTINITKEDDGWTSVQVVGWSISNTEVVELNGVHPHRKFYLKNAYKLLNQTPHGNYQLHVWLTLTLDKQSCEQTQDRPCAVWGLNVSAMNDGKTIPFNKSSINQWDSEPFLFEIFGSDHRNLVLDCLILIKFEPTKGASFTAGEQKLVQQITELFVRQNKCDVLFLFKDKQQIGGHVTILAARSPVLAAMFQHNMKEHQRGKVDILDVKLDIFKQLLHYIYSGRLGTPLSEDDVQPLYVAADKYYVGDLKEECVEYLLSHIKVDNAVQLLAWAHLHSIDKVQEAVLDFSALHGNAICMLDDWINLAQNYPDLCVLATRRMMANMSVLNKPLQREDIHHSRPKDC